MAKSDNVVIYKNGKKISFPRPDNWVDYDDEKKEDKEEQEKKLTDEKFNKQRKIDEKNAMADYWEDHRKKLKKGWEEVDTKYVEDSDGFTTQYTLYKNDEGKFRTVFGDKDLYGPNDDSDMDFDNEKEAREFFNTYKGFEEDSSNNDEYKLYQRARINPDSIDPMTENSTDWEALDKKYGERFSKDYANSQIKTAEVSLSGSKKALEMEKENYDRAKRNGASSMDLADRKKKINDLELEVQKEEGFYNKVKKDAESGEYEKKYTKVISNKDQDNRTQKDLLEDRRKFESEMAENYDDKKAKEFDEKFQKRMHELADQDDIDKSYMDTAKKDQERAKTFKLRTQTYFGSNDLGEWEGKDFNEARENFFKENPRYRNGDFGMVTGSEVKKVNTNNQQLYNDIMKDYDKHDQLKSEYEKASKEHNEKHDKMFKEWQSYEYGTPEYKEMYKKLTEDSNEFSRKYSKTRDKLNKMEAIKALEDQNEAVIFNDKGEPLFNPNYYDKDRERREVKLGIDVRGETAVKDKEMLDSVVGQLSDGIWENSPGQEKYWRHIDYEQHNNEIVFSTPIYGKRHPSGRPISNPFMEKNDKEVKDYLANKIKQIVKVEMDDNPSIGKWDRNNQNTLSYLGYNDNITVAEAYNLYDRLKGRTIKESKPNTTDARKSYNEYLNSLKDKSKSKMSYQEYFNNIFKK